MGDQQQKIEALRAAMTSIQERDPDEPVPDFLVVDTSVPEKPLASTSASPVDAAGSEDEDEDPEGEAPGVDLSTPGDIGFATQRPDGGADGPLRFGAALEARPLVDPVADSRDFDFPDSDGAGSDGADVGISGFDALDFGTRDLNSPGPATPSAEETVEDEDAAPAGAMAGLSPEEQYEKARAVVLRRLTGSPKSRHQLAVVLKDKEFSPEIITRVLDRMEEVHLVNDVEFAHTWVKGRHELKNLGRSALRRELREKGISEPVAADALEQISAEDEGAAARELVRRKLQGRAVPTGPSPEERAERDKVTRRLVSMLARRGHAPGAAFQIVREVIEDHSGA